MPTNPTECERCKLWRRYAVLLAREADRGLDLAAGHGIKLSSDAELSEARRLRVVLGLSFGWQHAD